MDLFVVLGADDPEMSAIEQVLKDHNVCYAYGVNWRKRRVQSYEANRAYLNKDDLMSLGKATKVVLIETCLTDPYLLIEKDIVIIGHHNPGDPGFGLPPERYREGSSLGQLLTLLDIEPTEEQLFCMAADHCLTSAYRGECPGVNPKALRRWRSMSKASFQGLSLEEYEASLKEGFEFVRDLPRIELGGMVMADSRETDGHQQLPEAAAILGTPVLYRTVIRNRDTGEEDGVKVGLLNGSPAEISTFLEMAESELGLHKPYGDPARGFAGGYEKLPSRMGD